MTRHDVTGRLVESRDESTELRSLLEAGIADESSDYDYESGLKAHLAAVGGPPGGGGPAAPAGAGPASQTAAGGASAKAMALAIGLPIASLSALAAVVLLRAHGPTGADSTLGAERAPSAIVETNGAHEGIRAESVVTVPPALLPGARESEPAAPARSGRHAGEAAARQRAATGTEAIENQRGIVRNFPEGPVEPNRPAPGPVSQPAVHDAPPAAAARVVAPDAPRPTEEELARAERAKEEARRSEEDKLQREMDELMRAKRALSGNPKLALELAERGQREFRQSLLHEEREHVLLLALIGVGRVSEAERRAAPYLAKHPDSPFARRVRAALEASRSRGSR
jgi:hypothetical protein